MEDEAIIALDLRQRLEDLGYVVTGIAVNGADALALAETTDPTLVFMDITIQGAIDGIETAKTLSSRMDVPIVFLTAHADARTIERAKAALFRGLRPVAACRTATVEWPSTAQAARAHLRQTAVGLALMGSHCMRPPAQAGSTLRVARHCCATSCDLRLRRSEWNNVPTALCM